MKDLCKTIGIILIAINLIFTVLGCNLLGFLNEEDAPITETQPESESETESTDPSISLQRPEEGSQHSYYPGFSWEGSTNKYHFQITSDQNFKFIVWETDSLDSNAVDLQNLELTPSNYYWRVRGQESNGSWTEWSETRSFTLHPLTITGAVPGDGGTSINLIPLLSWTAAEGAEAYDIQVASDDAFVSIIEEASGTDTEFLCSEERYSLQNEYHWRIRSIDSAGNISCWSSGKSFTIELPVEIITTLRSLSFSEGALEPPFEPDNLYYNLMMPAGTQFTQLDYLALDSRATAQTTLVRYIPQMVFYPFNGSLPHNMSLQKSDVITIEVSGAGSTTQTYQISPQFYYSSKLRELEPASGSFSPSFNSEIVDYSLSLPSGSATIDFSFTEEENTATTDVTRNGSSVSLPSAVAHGDVFRFLVASDDPSIVDTQYQVTVNIPSGAGAVNTGLFSLGESVGTLSPQFVSETREYTLLLPINTNSCSLNPVRLDNRANIAIELDGSSVSSWPVTVSDSSVFTIMVSGASAASTLYTINVDKSHSAMLSSISSSTGSLSPAFNSYTSSYSINVPQGTSSITLNHSQVDQSASVVVSYNGSTVNSWPVSISDGGRFIYSVSAGAVSESYSLTIDEAEAQPTGNDLLITEISGNQYANRQEWVELYNDSQNPINLNNYSLRFASSLENETGTVHSFSFPSRVVDPGETVVVRPNPGGDEKPGHYNIFISNSQGAFFNWGYHGCVELIKNGSTVDFIRFGANQNDPLTGGSWTGANAPALTPLTNTYGISLTRNYDNQDSNSAADWTHVEWASPGAPHDVLGSVDNDADGIPDANEVQGATYLGLPLYQWGARSGVVDHFVHVSYMHNASGTSPGIYPRPEALANVVEAFESQSATTTQHRVHYDIGDTSGYSAYFGVGIEAYNLDGQDHSVPYSETVTLTQDPAAVADFYELKANSLPTNKRMIFHYMLAGSAQPSRASGTAEVNGNDILITVNENRNPMNPGDTQTYHINFQSLAYMHELGHNLGLLHGGNESVNYKPNYYSIMNYMYSAGKGLPTIGHGSEGDRYYYYQHTKVFSGDQSNIFASMYNNSFYASDLHNSLYTNDFVIDFSDGSGADLNENSLNESIGIGRPGSAWIDFNGNGSVDTNLSYNLNSTDSGSLSILRDFNDWAAIQSVFRRRDTIQFRSSNSGDHLDSFDPINSDQQVTTVDYFEDPMSQGE